MASAQISEKLTGRLAAGFIRIQVFYVRQASAAHYRPIISLPVLAIDVQL